MSEDVLRAIQHGDTAEYVAVIKKQAASVVRRLPKPDGTGWTPQDIEDLRSEFYASAAYEHAVLNAHDDESLRKLVYTGLVNLVRAELRRTDRGRLLRRLKDLVSSEGYIEEPAKFWRRKDDPSEVSTVVMPDLIKAVWQVEVQVVKWRPDAKRNSPLAEKSSLLALLDAVYDRAKGAVHIDVLVEVFGQRLGVGPVSINEALDVADDRFTVDRESDPAEQLLDNENELDAAKAARALWDQLSPRERELAPHFASSARQAAHAIGGGKSAVNDAMNRLREKFRLALLDADDDNRRLVLRELLELSGGSPDS